jgi:hypothetical protein
MSAQGHYRGARFRRPVCCAEPLSETQSWESASEAAGADLASLLRRDALAFLSTHYERVDAKVSSASEGWRDSESARVSAGLGVLMCFWSLKSALAPGAAMLFSANLANCHLGVSVDVKHLFKSQLIMWAGKYMRGVKNPPTVVRQL